MRRQPWPLPVTQPHARPVTYTCAFVDTTLVVDTTNFLKVRLHHALIDIVSDDGA